MNYGMVMTQEALRLTGRNVFAHGLTKHSIVVDDVWVRANEDPHHELDSELLCDSTIAAGLRYTRTSVQPRHPRETERLIGTR